MDLNDVRALLTVLGFIGFIAIVAWAYSRGAKKGFTEASELPFADHEEALRSGEQGNNR
jgi:cytochrome c oxidase cbb3-type subunit IV